MKLITKLPIHVTYLGRAFYLSQEDFESLQRFRDDAIGDIKRCRCIVTNEGSYRVSYFGQQEPTKLVSGGEVDPTEISHHIDPCDYPEISDHIGLHVESDPFDLELWHSASGGTIKRLDWRKG